VDLRHASMALSGSARITIDKCRQASTSFVDLKGRSYTRKPRHKAHILSSYFGLSDFHWRIEIFILAIFKSHIVILSIVAGYCDNLFRVMPTVGARIQIDS
jgi:hypothetical protein